MQNISITNSQIKKQNTYQQLKGPLCPFPVITYPQKNLPS